MGREFKDIDVSDDILSNSLLGPHIVPYMWHYMLPKEIFELYIPEERQSTCMTCPKIASDSYREDYRCCTYHPNVPNFMLGLALKEPGSRELVKSFIESGYALPEGSVATPQRWYQYLDDNKKDLFGKGDKTLCHFLNAENGYCQIYNFRNSVCSTFFCLHDHGNGGDDFWEHVQTLVSQVESSLSQWALIHIGFDFQGYLENLNELAPKINQAALENNSWNVEWLKLLFGDWYQHRTELFERCAEAVGEKRNELWKLANETDILEAKAFEKQQYKDVPKKLRGELDGEEYEEDGDMVSPQKLWKKVKKSHQKLWNMPAAPARLTLNKRVNIHKNPLDFDEDKQRKEFPYVIDFLTKKDPNKYKWREYVTREEKDLLKYFEASICADDESVSKFLLQNGNVEKNRISQLRLHEWYAKGVLVQD